MKYINVNEVSICWEVSKPYITLIQWQHYIIVTIYRLLRSAGIVLYEKSPHCSDNRR
nr:MAG TPA: hypothetical protein [Caudoviricetes sp.]